MKGASNENHTGHRVVDDEELAWAILSAIEEFWDELVLVGTNIPGHPVSVQMVDADLTLDAPSMPKPHARLYEQPRG